MPIAFTFEEGSPSMVIDWPDHPIVKSPLVQNVLEVSTEEEDEDAEIALPEFISSDTMHVFVDFVNRKIEGETMMEFGKYYDKTYREVYRYHRDYYHWGKGQIRPSERLHAFLEWADDFRAHGTKPTIPHEELLPIAKYFQIDMCSGCGVLGPFDGGEETAAEVLLQPCRRMKWPRVPVVTPDYETVTRDIENSDEEKTRAWKEAWEQAEIQRKETGRVVCVCDDQLCKQCVISKRGCQFCKEWECAECQADTENKVEILQTWHEQSPISVFREEYESFGRRVNNNCPYRGMNSKPCLRCRRRTCQDCGHECNECHRLSCDGCKEDLKSLCIGCRDPIDNNDNNEIGARNRDEYVCRQCFDSKNMICDCGQPSYDPLAPSDDSGGEIQEEPSDLDGTSVEESDEYDRGEYDDYDEYDHGEYDQVDDFYPY